MSFTKIEGGITAPKGFLAGAVYAGIKDPNAKSEKPDVAVLYSEEPCASAACFTKNKFCAAPVILGREVLKKGSAQAIVINSGNANAATGEQGLKDAKAIEEAAEKLLGLGEDEVFVCSTGVIGKRLPYERVISGVEQIVPTLNKEQGTDAAWAIMTTDTVKKEVAYELPLAGGTVKIGAMAKGSGMIHPNMATMLAYVTTDAKVEASVLQPILSEAVEKSFNMTTVDGDTSTNDSIFILANGASGIEIKTEEDIEAFRGLVEGICIDMSRRRLRHTAFRLSTMHVLWPSPSQAHHSSRQPSSDAMPTGDVSWQQPDTPELMLILQTQTASSSQTQARFRLWKPDSDSTLTKRRQRPY